MNLWDRMKFVITGQPPKEADGVGHTVLPWQDDRPQYLLDNYRDFAVGGYGKNELVYACINQISRAVPEAPLRVYSAEDEALSEHPMRLLVKKPNPFMTEFELWEMTLIYLYLSGNAYWEKVRSAAGRVVELVPLRPDRVLIVPDEENYIKGYIYEIGGRRFELPQEDVIHFKKPNPIDDFFGMPPLRAGLRAVEVDNEATDFVKVLLQNKAVPGVVVTTQAQVDEDTATRLTRKWKQKFGGNKRGEPAFLQEGMDVKPVGMNLNELAFPDLRSISETRICAVFAVPPILVGAKTGLDRSTFANYEEARKAFWQETIFPLLRSLADKVNRDLMPEFERGGTTKNEAHFDTSNVTALQPVQNKKWDRANMAFKSGFLTVNEARSEIGKDPVDNGDVFIRALNVVGIPVDKNEEPLFVKPSDGSGTDGGEGSGDESNEPPPDDGSSDSQNPQQEAEPPPKARGPDALRVKQKQKMEAKQLELLRRSFERIGFAEEFFDAFFRFARREFQKEAREFMRRLEAESKAFDPETVEALLTALVTLGRQWATRIRDDVYPTFQNLINAAMAASADTLGISFNLDNEAAVAFIRQYTFQFADEMAATSKDQIRKTILRGQTEGMNTREIRDELTKQFTSWGIVRAEMVARSETIRASNKGAKFTYQQAGVEQVEWVASTDACLYCEALDGDQIPIHENFVDLGGQVTAEGADRPYTQDYESTDVPPLHPNCRCTILPVVEV